MTNSLLRFFDLIATFRRLGTAAILTFENWRWIRRDQFVTFQDKFRIDGVAGGLVNSVAAEVAVEFVFVIVVAAELQLFAIGRDFLFFIQHYQLRRAPRLTRPAHVTPKLEIRLVITAADKIIAERLGLDFLRHRDLRLLNSFRHSFATCKKKSAEKNLDPKKEFNRAFHS